MFGEWPESETWKKSLWYKCAKGAVIIGVMGELLADAGIFAAGDRVEELANAKIIALETKLAPRSLSNAEIAEVSDALRKFSGQQFTIGSYGGEPAMIAARVKTALEGAGWKFFVPENQIVLLAGTVGIQVWAWPEGPARDAGKALTAVLNGKAFDAQLLPERPYNDDPNMTKIEILVGSKY